MKKLFVIALCVALAVVAVACTATAAPSEPAVDEPMSIPAVPNENNPPVAPAEPAAPTAYPTPTVQEDKGMVADAAMYRGTVTSATVATDKDGKPTLVLGVKQAEGTNFGAPELQFAIGNDTRISFSLEQLEELTNQYLEVYYSYNTRNAPDPDELYSAIHVNLYGDVAMYNFNGTVAEIAPHPDKPGEGRLLMNDLANPEFQTYYLYGPETQMYINFEDIKVGDKLNILHSPAMAMSMPPQCAAWEIRSCRDAMTK